MSGRSPDSLSPVLLWRIMGTVCQVGHDVLEVADLLNHCCIGAILDFFNEDLKSLLKLPSNLPTQALTLDGLAEAEIFSGSFLACTPRVLGLAFTIAVEPFDFGVYTLHQLWIPRLS